jgi:hypothetical protein
MDVNNDPIVLTAMSPRNAYRGTWQKQAWISKHFSQLTPPVIVCQRKHKQDWAMPNRVLIDDNEQNIKEWIKKGGIGVFYKNHKQAIEELEFVKDMYAASNPVGHSQ